MRRELKLAAEVVALLAIGLLSTHLALPEGLRGAVLSLIYWGDTDTKWAVGYSPMAFRFVRVGDTQEAVLRSLGEPLTREVSAYHPGTVFWKYSISPGKGNFHQRWILIDSTGHVKMKVSEYYVD